MSEERKHGDSFPEPVSAATAAAIHAKSAEELTHGTVYTGEIISRDQDGTYRVSVDDPKKEIMGARIAFPVLGGLFGLNVICTLSQLTRVKIVYGKPSFILAVIPEVPTDFRNGRTRSLLLGPDADEAVGVTDGFSYHAQDLLEGEVEMTNLYGVALDFLTTIMRMRAGDKAMVECHLINDMVRVVSGQYRHISGLGDELIFDHGRPTLERSWSSYRHEVMGALKENEDFTPLKGDEIDRAELNSKRVTGMGRNRFWEYVGFAGDFIHSFISDPPEDTLVTITKAAAAAGAGKSWMHRNADGTVIIQSVADIRLERVCRIPVAVRAEPHEDPKITKERVYDRLEKDFLKLPKIISPTDRKDAFQVAYHIRSYARWLGRYHAFARMLQMEAEYNIPSEEGSPIPDWNNQEKDRENQNPRVDYYDAYACIAIMRDGSIVLHDGYGSSFVLSNGNVQISASRHIDIEAAGDIRMISGGSILMKARRNIELSATLGGVIVHAYAWLKMICERGTAWLRSNAVSNQDPADFQKDGGPVPEVAGWEPDVEGHGVLIEAAAGTATFRSERKMSIATDGAAENDDDRDFDLVVASRGGALDLSGKISADLHSSKSVAISSPNIVTVYATTVLSSASKLLVGPDMDAPIIALQNGRLYCKNIEAKRVAADGLYGPEVGPEIPRPDPSPLLPLKRHVNHVRTLKKKIEDPDPATEREQKAVEKAGKKANAKPELPWEGSGDGPEWAFPEREEYVWDDREATVGCIPETLTQQHLRLDTTTTDPDGYGVDRWGGLGYEDWTVRSSISGPRTRSRGGFGSYELSYKADDQGDDLHKPTSNAAKDTTEVKNSWQAKANFSIKALKRPPAE